MSKPEWIPVSDYENSQLEISYAGNYAQFLELNRPRVERFLDIASLDGKVLLTESRVKKPNPMPDINPDGSVSGRKSLRFGEKPAEEIKGNPYYQTKADHNGYLIAVNGTMIAEDLMKANSRNARESIGEFGQKFNAQFRGGLRDLLWKDKCTYQQDPYLMGRIVGTLVVLNGYFQAIYQQDLLGITLVGINTLGLYGANFVNKDEHDKEYKQVKKYRGIRHFGSVGFATYQRKTVRSIYEGMSIPFEVDRLTRAEVYLDWLTLSRKPLIKTVTT